MPAHSKLPESHWAEARARWESDLRNGYAWLVADLDMQITRAAVRNRAIREGWRKKAEEFPEELQAQSRNPQSSCNCCGNHDPIEKTTVRRGGVTQSEILDRLARALEIMAECARTLKETMSQRNHQ